ncbi:MAG: TonB-dependent receptor [Kiritimatiellia bacterium]
MNKKLQLIAVSIASLFSVFLPSMCLHAQDADSMGTLRVQVIDADWEAPLAGASVSVVELDKLSKTEDDGSVLFKEIPFGKYNLLVSYSGFERQLMRGVVVNPGEVQQVVIRLSPIYTDMDELVVRDFDVSMGSDTALIELKMDSVASFDAVSADTISRAGASDAASALKLVSGATVQEGKYAVVRGLPDRYVNSQINGVRLPTADPEKRAVQLDQFPSAMIESIRVSKIFMPDQQGDATGGAIDIRLKRIPDKTIAKASIGMAWNDNITGHNLLSSKDGGVPYWADDNGDHALPVGVDAFNYFEDLEPDGREPTSQRRWDSISRDPDENAALQAAWKNYWGAKANQNNLFSDAISPIYKKADPGTSWSAVIGDKFDLSDDVRWGFLGTFSYKYDVSGYRKGRLEKHIVRNEGTEEDPSLVMDDWHYFGRSSTYDVEKGTESVLWGGALATGFESPWINIGLTYLRSQAAENSVSRIRDDSQYDYDTGIGQIWQDHSIYYSERMTETTLLEVEHPWFFLPDDMDVTDGREWFVFNPPVTDWAISRNKTSLYEPDRRLFSQEYADSSPDADGVWQKAADFGALERRWRDIEENGWQYKVNQKIPFRIWDETEGFFKGGYFEDQVKRRYVQDTYLYDSTGVDGGYATYTWNPWEDLSDNFELGYPDKSQPWVQGWMAEPAGFDIDYSGDQNIKAWYWMADVPVCKYLSFQGGLRVEKTEISARMKPSDGTYGSGFAIYTLEERDDGSMNISSLQIDDEEQLEEYTPNLDRNDRLPALGTTITPIDKLNLRLNWSETVARPTFKELMPVAYKESATSDTYFGNPSLKMSEIENYDVRLEYMPSAGQLISVSYFYKDLKDPIDVRAFNYNEGDMFITPVNYPEGEISGWEFEVRQDMGAWWKYAKGLTLGFNLTLMDSEVTRPADEYETLKEFGADKTRRMAGQPDYILGTYAMYDIEDWGTSFGLFFNRRGDALASGDSYHGEYDVYVPCIYEEALEQLDFTFSQKFLDRWAVSFKVKNLLDPQVKRMYRTEDGKEALRSSYRKGREYSISLSCEW